MNEYIVLSLCVCQGCMRCHPECRMCNGPGQTFCTECLHLWQDKECVSNCSVNHYYNATGDVCSPCNPHCHRCTGPTAADCISCKQFKLIYRTAAEYGQDTSEVLTSVRWFSDSMDHGSCMHRFQTAVYGDNILCPEICGNGTGQAGISK